MDNAHCASDCVGGDSFTLASVGEKALPYSTRVLSKQEDFPSVSELAKLIGDRHPGYKLAVEDGTEDDWDTLLLSGEDGVEVAVIEHNPVAEGYIGQDDIAEFIEETRDCR